MRPNQRLRVLLFCLALAAVPTLLRAQTQTIGAFITPVSATASSSQSDAGRTPDKLIDNATVLITSVIKAKPSVAKGKYIKGCTLSSTMGPGISLDVSPIETAAKA